MYPKPIQASLIGLIISLLFLTTNIVFAQSFNHCEDIIPSTSTIIAPGANLTPSYTETAYPSFFINNLSVVITADRTSFSFKLNGETDLTQFKDKKINDTWNIIITNTDDTTTGSNVIVTKWCLTGEIKEPQLSPPSDTSINLEVPVGQTSDWETIRIENIGNGPVKILSTSLDSLPVDEILIDVLSSPLPLTLSKGGDFTEIKIRCQPQTSGEFTANLTLTSDAPGQSNIIYPLKCNGLVPKLDPNPSGSVNFMGDIEIAWDIISSESINISNIGQAPLVVNLGSPYLIGKNPNNFGFYFDSDNNVGTQKSDFPITVQAGGEYSIFVKCIPNERKKYEAILQLTTNDPNNKNITYPLVCDAKAAAFKSDNSVNFGNILVGTPVEKIIKIDNLGNLDLKVNLGEFDLINWTRGDKIFQEDDSKGICIVKNDSSCLTSQEALQMDPFLTIAPNGSSQFKVRCQPQTVGEHKTTLLLNSNDPDHSNIQYQLTCTGVQPLYDSKPVAPNGTLDFGEVPIETDGEKMLEIQEIGTDDLKINSATLLDDTEAVFSLVETTFPLTIPNDSGESQKITAQCQPREEDKIYTAKLKLTTNAVNYPEPVYDLTCKGGPPVAGARYHSTPVYPGDTLDFGKVTIGTSRDKTFTIKEIGNLALVVQLATSLKQKEFTLVSPSFFPNLTIRDGEEGVLVTFQCLPLQEGTYTDQIRFTTNDLMLPELSYNLKCIGVAAPGYSSSPVLPGGTIDFGAGPVGIPINKTLEIEEVGSKDLTVDLATTPITGTHPNSFSLKSPTFPLSIANNAPAQTLTIQCTPATLGTQTAVLNLTSNDSSHSVIKYNLSCAGVDLNQLVNLTVATAGSGSGLISPQLSGSVRVEKCGTHCFSYAKETPVTLTAIPNQGSIFTHWAGDCSGTEVSVVVNMSQNKTCTASFDPVAPPTPNQKVLTLEIAGTGIVTSQPNGLDCPNTTCSASYSNDTEVTLEAMSAKGFSLSEIGGDCDAQGHVKLDADKVCKVTFTPNVTHAGQLQFAQTEFTVNPQARNLTLTVTRTEENESKVEVSYYTTDDQGVHFNDLIGGEGILQWQAGDSTDKTFEITIVPEYFADNDYFLIHLTNPSGGATLGTQPTATIRLEKLPATVKTAPTDIKLCPLTSVINVVCHLNWQTGKDITIGEEGNISAALLQGTIVNNGWIGNFVLQPESTLTGGNITGYVLNHGEIRDVKFKGASLEGGILAGTVWNESPANGVIRDVIIAENSTLMGGKVGGQITNQGTITDIQFRGTQLTGGTLTGDIENVSGGIIQDVILAENTHLDGGRLQGYIKGIGKGDSRPLLENVIITPDTQLENVRIGSNVNVPAGFKFSADVTFAEQPHFVTNTFITGKVNGNGQVLENITINEQGNLTNATLAGTVINLGKVSDITVQADSRLTGGVLNNEIINNGTISDVELNQAHLVGGHLEGQINASGSILEEVSLGAGTQLKGGELHGQIQGDAQSPARLDSLTVAKDGYVENAIIGQKVKNQGTLADIEFQGTTLAGGTLSGQVITSRGGTVRDVKLAPNTSLNGGNLQGKIIGDPESPAHLDNVAIVANSYLENVVIGDNVKGTQLKIGNNVTMAATGIQLTSGTQQNLGQKDNPVSEPQQPAVQVLDLKTGQLTENLSAKFEEDIRTSLGEKRSSGALLSYLDAEILKISATITNQTSVSQAADLIMIAYYQSVEGTPYYLQYDGQQQQWTPWDFDFQSLKSAQSQPLLFNPKQSVKITAFEGDLSLYPGQFELYIGYRSTQDNTLTFNGVKPITFYVGIAPPSCIVYAVHDASISDTQLIRINLSGGLDGDMEPLGQLHKGYDIEGLALHSSDPNLLYGTAGENAKVNGQRQGGYLYTINRQTGELSVVGPTGFNKVSGLAFNPKDKTLWGWGRNQGKNSTDKWNGIIKIDPETGHGEMIKQFDSFNMEGLAWNAQGSKLYAATGTSLWVYDPELQEIKLACENVTNEGKIEGLDMQPNGSLLIGVDYDKPTQTTIFAYDPQKCERVEKATRTFWGTYYDDLESFVWPSGECSNQSWL